MEHVRFYRNAGTSEQRMLELALEGDFEAFKSFAESGPFDPKRIEIFMADNSGWGIPPVKHYLLFEVAQRGFADLFVFLVERYGYVTTIYEDEYNRTLRAEIEFEERSKRDMPNLIFDSASKHRATNSAYYCTLPKYLASCNKEARQKLREMTAKWLSVALAMHTLGPKLTDVDDEELTAYESAHHSWLYGSFPLIRFEDGKDEERRRKHQRSRPRVNPQFSNELERRRLAAMAASCRKECRALLSTFQGTKRMLDYLNEHQTKPAA